MIQIGDRVRRMVGFVDLEHHMTAPVPMPCECVIEYIHPEHRFYTLRVLLPDGRSFRTTEYFYPRGGTTI